MHNLNMDGSLHEVIEDEFCLFSQTDSLTAMGWLRKTNFADKTNQAVQ
jgi:hypothetical protein